MDVIYRCYLISNHFDFCRQKATQSPKLNLLAKKYNISRWIEGYVCYQHLQRPLRLI